MGEDLQEGQRKKGEGGGTGLLQRNAVAKTHQPISIGNRGSTEREILGRAPRGGGKLERIYLQSIGEGRGRKEENGPITWQKKIVPFLGKRLTEKEEVIAEGRTGSEGQRIREKQK